MSQPNRLIRKIVWSDIFLVRKKMLVRIIFWYDFFWVGKFVGQKKIWSEIFFLSECFWSEKNFGWKKIWSEFFFVQNFFGRTFFFMWKHFGSERFKPIIACWPLFCLLDYSSDLVKMMLHSKNPLPRLGGGQVTPIFFT